MNPPLIKPRRLPLYTSARWAAPLIAGLLFAGFAQNVNLTVNASQTIRTVDERVFGVNSVTWDWQTSNAQTISLAKAAGIRAFRIPGGSESDGFHWAKNSTQVANVWAFNAFTQLITGVNAQTFVTTNYGSGTAQEAAAWVAYSNASATLLGTASDVNLGVDSNGTDWHTAGYWSALRAAAPLATDDGLNYMRLNHPAPFALKYWEIGNECYGSWEEDLHNPQWDPVTYANIGATYITLMKSVDPTIKIGAVSEVSENALDSKSPVHTVTNPVTGISHHGWTPVMLTQFKSLNVFPDFLIYHRYEQAPGAENDQALLMAPENGASQTGQGWAADAAGLRAQLTDYLGATLGGAVELDITENNSVYGNPGKQSTSLVNGLYLADSIANVLKTEFNSLLWWDIRNGEDNTQNNSSALYGWRMYGDYGILATPAGKSWGDASYFDGYPAYYTMKLLQYFARGGDTIVQATSDNALLPVYAAKRADGSLSLLVINKAPTTTYSGNISLTSFVPLPNATVYSYGIPQDTAAQTGSGSADIATTTISNAAATFSISAAPYSATVISLQPAPAVPTISSQPKASQTVTQGTNVTLSVVAASNPSPTYQWQREAAGTTTWTNLSDGGAYSGSLTNSLTVTTSAAMNGDAYQCVLTNTNGTATTTQANLIVESPLATLTLAGQAGVAGHTDGTGSAAMFNGPADIALDSSGNAYVADANNSTVRMVTPAGIVTTLAGQFGVSGSTDGSGTTALFNHPAGIAVDGSGNAYVADTGNNTIRKLVIATGAVTTLAGQAGVAGSSDCAGTAASFDGLSGIAVDSTGNLYVSDTLNHTIRKVTAAGAVSTIAGTAGSSGFTNATGTAALFHGPQGLTLDASGDLFVADTNNNAIRKLVIATGVVTTAAVQSGTAGAVDGANSQAQFHYPSSVAVDSTGNLYVVDTDNHALREIAADGAVSTLAGLAGTSGSADGVGTSALFNFPTGVAVRSNITAPAGLLPGPISSTVVYVADTTNNTIRLALAPVAPSITTQPQSQTVTAGANVTFTVAASGSPMPSYQWLLNGSPISGASSASYALSNAQSSNAGSYTVTVKNVVGSVTSNVATLTVTSNTPPPAPSSGGGGGGAPSLWFCGALSLLAYARLMRRRK
jgi:hypothetical protein